MTTGYSAKTAPETSAAGETHTTERMTGSQAIIRSLEMLGVTDVFGLPGGIPPRLTTSWCATSKVQGTPLKGMRPPPAK